MCAHPHAGNIANETRCWDRRMSGTGSFGVSRVGRRSTILRWINAGSSGDGLNQRLYAECLLAVRGMSLGPTKVYGDLIRYRTPLSEALARDKNYTLPVWALSIEISPQAMTRGVCIYIHILPPTPALQSAQDD